MPETMFPILITEGAAGSLPNDMEALLASTQTPLYTEKYIIGEQYL